MVFKEEDYKYEHFIISQIEEGFIHVQFNNPKKLNAFNEKLWRAYGEILTRLDKDEDTNVILISSAVPKSFSSGLDLKEATSLMNADPSRTDQQKYDQLHRFITDFQDNIGVPARMSTPTIGLLNGINIGLALDLSAAYSIRIAVADAKFSIREIKIGLTADMGVLQRIPQLVNNKSRLFQHALTGDFWGAEEALNLGYVSEVVPDLKTGLEVCTKLGLDINNNIQWAIKGTKDSIQTMVDNQPVERGLKEVVLLNTVRLGDIDLRNVSKL